MMTIKDRLTAQRIAHAGLGVLLSLVAGGGSFYYLVSHWAEITARSNLDAAALCAMCLLVTLSPAGHWMISPLRTGYDAILELCFAVLSFSGLGLAAIAFHAQPYEWGFWVAGALIFWGAPHSPFWIRDNQS